MPEPKIDKLAIKHKLKRERTDDTRLQLNMCSKSKFWNSMKL